MGFTLRKLGNNRVQVVDSLDGYLSEDSNLVPYKKFKYSETVSLNILMENNSIISYFMSEHNRDSETVFQLPHDGRYTIYHIILPTEEWIRKISLSDAIRYDKIFTIINNILYLYNVHTQNVEETSVEEVLQNLNNVIWSRLEVFSIDSFEESINSLMTEESCYCNPKQLNLDNCLTLYEILKYYLECGNFDKAEKYLPKISSNLRKKSNTKFEKYKVPEIPKEEPNCDCYERTLL